MELILELITFFSGEPFIPREGMRCAVALDTSGGLPYDFLVEELSYIKEKFSGLENFEILVYTFDTRVYGPAKYNAKNLQYITNIEYRGGGGTLFFPIYNAMVESGADTFVMFTDGYFVENVEDVEDPRLNIFLWDCTTGAERWMPKCNIAHYSVV